MLKLVIGGESSNVQQGHSLMYRYFGEFVKKVVQLRICGGGKENLVTVDIGELVSISFLQLFCSQSLQQTCVNDVDQHDLYVRAHQSGKETFKSSDLVNMFAADKAFG